MVVDRVEAVLLSPGTPRTAIWLFCDQFRRCAPAPARRDEIRVREIRVVRLVALAVNQRFPVQRKRLPACGAQDGIARRRVPLHGTAEAGIDIGNTLGNETEL